ncbi:hypothetical protein D3C81_1720490 [compost metagenome]
MAPGRTRPLRRPCSGMTKAGRIAAYGAYQFQHARSSRKRARTGLAQPPAEIKSSAYPEAGLAPARRTPKGDAYGVTPPPSVPGRVISAQIACCSRTVNAQRRYPVPPPPASSSARTYWLRPGEPSPPGSEADTDELAQRSADETHQNW